MKNDSFLFAFDRLGAWFDILPHTISHPALELAEVVYSRKATVYPPAEQVFAALQHTPPERVKAVILGQDPYHGPGQANGLAFSVNPGVQLPPSLRNIFAELESDIGCVPPANNGDLTAWAKQGVLLLNTSLTVEEGKAGSHSKIGWQNFTKGIISACAQMPQPIVFILWGAHAQELGNAVGENPTKKKLMSPHPSPLSAYRGFFGSKPFSKTNLLLMEMGAEPIDWTL